MLSVSLAVMRSTTSTPIAESLAVRRRLLKTSLRCASWTAQ